MFIDSTRDILRIAKSNGFSIFANFDLDPRTIFPSTHTFILEPDDKTGKISVDAVRDFFTASTRETTDVFFIIISPESMNPEAMNAILKILEEPKTHYHYIFFTARPSTLLPTILSRASIYYQRQVHFLDSSVVADDKTKTLAKRLLTVRPTELITLAKEISDKKDRKYALDIIETAIELATKSYFKTNNPMFLRKLDNLLPLHDNISANGHIKLHFVADML